MTTTSETCPCGRPLHYSSEPARVDVQMLVELLGPTVPVQTMHGTWRVPRHYIALHGLKAWQVPDLARRHGWEQVE